MSAAPAVLALHGITSNGRSWDAVARELGREVRLIAPDQRGRADAAACGEPYGIARHVADAVELLDREGLDDVLVVGHSMGAYVAARLAAEHPERVRALVAVDGALPLPVPEGADPDALIEATLGPAIERLTMTFEDLAAHRAFWRAHPAFSGDEISDEDVAAFADHDLGGEPPALRSRVVPEAVRADGRDLLVDGETRGALARVTVPGILLRAPRGLLDEDDPFLPAARVDAFAHATVELREVPDTNHYTIELGARGARAVADAIRELL